MSEATEFIFKIAPILVVVAMVSGLIYGFFYKWINKTLTLLSMILKKIHKLFLYRVMIILIMRAYIVSAITPLLFPSPYVEQFAYIFYSIISFGWITMPLWGAFSQGYDDLKFILKMHKQNKLRNIKRKGNKK